MDDVAGLLTQFKTVGLFAGAAGWVANFLINLLTHIWPNRPKWAPPFGAMLLGVVTVFILCKAFSVTFTEPVYYQVVIVGIIAGALAWAADAAKQGAENARTDAWAQTPEGQAIIEEQKKLAEDVPPDGVERRASRLAHEHEYDH